MTPVSEESGSSTPVIIVSADAVVPETVETQVEGEHADKESVAVPETADSEAKEDADEEVKEVIKVGMECNLKHLYQKEDDKGRTSWTDKYPEDLEEAAENETTAKFAILVRNRKSFEDSRKKLEIDSIVVQSPLLKIVLSRVLKDYPGRFDVRHLPNMNPFTANVVHRHHLHAQTTGVPSTIQPFRSSMGRIYCGAR